jgi:hypothetical protein
MYTFLKTFHPGGTQSGREGQWELGRAGPQQQPFKRIIYTNTEFLSRDQSKDQS